MTIKEAKKKARQEYLLSHPDVSPMNVEAVLTDDGIKIADWTPCLPCLPFKGRHKISNLNPSL